MSAAAARLESPLGDFFVAKSRCRNFLTPICRFLQLAATTASAFAGRRSRVIFSVTTRGAAMPPFLLTLAALLSVASVFVVGLVHAYLAAPVLTFVAVVVMLAFVVYLLVDLDKTVREIEGRAE